MAANRYVIAYDVQSDRIRGRIADVLEGFGVRVQYSVFECLLERRDLDTLVGRLERELQEPKNGSIRVYRLCERCERQSFGLGQIEVDDEPFYFV